jgi:hypothetical protein
MRHWKTIVCLLATSCVPSFRKDAEVSQQTSPPQHHQFSTPEKLVPLPETDELDISIARLGDVAKSELKGSDFLTEEKSQTLISEAKKAIKGEASSLVFLRCDNLIVNAFNSDPTHCKDVLDFKDFIFDFSFNSYNIETNNTCFQGAPGCKFHQIINMRHGTGHSGPVFVSKESLANTVLLYTRGVFSAPRPLGLEKIIADFFPIIIPTTEIPPIVGVDIGAALQKPSLQIQNIVHLSNVWRDGNLGKRKAIAITQAAIISSMAGAALMGGFAAGATAKSILPAVLAKQPLSALIALGTLAEVPGNIARVILEIGNIRNRVTSFPKGSPERIAAESTIFIADACSMLGFGKQGASTARILSDKVALNLLILVVGAVGVTVATSPVKDQLSSAILNGEREHVFAILDKVSAEGLQSDPSK